MPTKQTHTMVMTDAQLGTITGGIILNNGGRRGGNRSDKRTRPGQRDEPRRIAEWWEIECWEAGPHRPR